MDVQLQLGGTLDIASGAEVTRMGNDIKRAFRDEFQRSLVFPIARKLTSQSETAPASGIVKAVVGTAVPPGRYWSLRSLVILGDDDHTAVTNASAALYIGDPVNHGLAEVNDTFNTVPASEQYSAGELIAGPGDAFFVVAYGITVAHTIVVNARFEDFPASSIVPGAV